MFDPDKRNKTLKHTVMKTLTLLIATLLTTTTFAQDETQWIGGTPGQETEWHQARNWSTNEVPDEDTHVVIDFLNSGHNSQPTISQDAVAASIEVRSLGKLTITDNAELIIDGMDTYTEGISLYGGQIENLGSIFFYNLHIELTQEELSQFQGEGYVFVDDKHKELEASGPHFAQQTK
jgi:hypothetical protein